MKFDSAGQEVREGDWIYIIVAGGSSFHTRIGQIIGIDKTGLHCISEMYGTIKKGKVPTTFIRIEETKLTMKLKQPFKDFYQNWLKTHKESR